MSDELVKSSCKVDSAGYSTGPVSDGGMDPRNRLALSRDGFAVRGPDIRTHRENRVVACEPFPTNTVEKEVRNGMAVPKQKGALAKLKVIFQSGDLYPGYSVFVRSDLFNSIWAKAVYEVEGRKFILIPEAEIALIDPRS